MAMDGAQMAVERQAAMDAVASPQNENPADTAAYRAALLVADSNAIVAHIVANSELVSITHDTGTAGAGIRTGSVK